MSSAILRIREPREGYHVITEDQAILAYRRMEVDASECL